MAQFTVGSKVKIVGDYQTPHMMQFAIGKMGEVVSLLNYDSHREYKVRINTGEAYPPEVWCYGSELQEAS